MVEQERRQYHHLREIFEDAYIIALPFLDPKQGLGGIPMVRHAYIRLREEYPELSQQEIAILVPALERVFAERKKMS